MKNKIAQFTLLAALGMLLLAPSAMPKGKPAGLQMSAACHDGGLPDAVPNSDVCSVTITGLAAGKSYQLEGVNNCAGIPLFMSIAADSTGNYTNPNITPESDPVLGCTVNNWTFYLLTMSGRELASATALDQP